ncbi:MAG: hypothetical protein Q9169_007660 [Polycauliona sp. 2 TL-2023]
MPGVIKRARYHPPHHDAAKHYFANGTWHHPTDYRPSCYRDFVPCSYDEKTIVARIYKYVRTLLAQTNGTILHQRQRLPPAAPSNTGWSDFEMISTSPSPTLCANPAINTSPRSLYHRPDNSTRSRDGSYRTSKFTATTTTSPRPYIRPPPAAAFSNQSTQSPLAAPNPHKRPRSASTQSSPSTSVTAKVDAGTQYSPPLLPTTQPKQDITKSKGKRRSDNSSSPEEETIPEIPPEPPLAPQMSVKRTAGSTSWTDSTSTSTSSTQATATTATTAPPTTSSQTSSTTSSSPSNSKRPRPTNPTPKLMPPPSRYETCDTPSLVLLISTMLTDLIHFNDSIPLNPTRLTRFHSRAPPSISIKDYLQRLTTHATLSPPILLSMVYYIDKLCALYPAFTISSLTVHRFLITSATVASKGLSDSFWTNSLYARVGGVSLKELALLELEFLWRVEWRIVPRPEQLKDYYRSLVERSEGFRLEKGGGSGSGSGSGSSSRAGSEKAGGGRGSRSASDKGGASSGSESGGSSAGVDGVMDTDK